VSGNRSFAGRSRRGPGTFLDNGKPDKMMSDGKTDESGKIAMVQIGYARVSTLDQEMALQNFRATNAARNHRRPKGCMVETVPGSAPGRRSVCALYLRRLAISR
jgi:hypothetical protein